MTDIASLGPHDYTKEQLLARLEVERPAVIAVDTETVSLKDRRIIGLGIALNEREAVYFPIRPYLSADIQSAWRLLAGASLKVFHHALYDLTALAEYAPSTDTGFIGPVFVDSQPLLADTAVMGHIQGIPSSKLKDMAQAYLSMAIDEIADILPKGCTMLDVPQPDVAFKCMQDCLATLRLYRKMGGEAWWGTDGHTWSYTPSYVLGWNPSEPTSYHVTPAMKDCYQVDIRVMPLLMRMSKRGLGLRSEKLESWYKKLRAEQLFYEGLCDKEGFNPASPQQVGYTLAARGSFLPFTKSRRQLKTDDETLKGVTDPLAIVVLRYRQASKLLSTYILPWLGVDEDGIHHPHERAYTHLYLDTGTGRLKSSGRNLQNVPVPVRDIFTPDTGVWSWADYREIEMRMIAYASQDPMMLKVYQDGGSVHTDTQLTLWPGSDPRDAAQRLRAKTFNFAMSFWAADRTLARHTGLPVETCRQYKAVWMDRYKAAADWIQEQIMEGPYRGYATTIFGRKARLPRLGEVAFEHIQKCAINYTPQGSAADVVKRAMLRCDDMGFNQALQVHDEILVDGVVEFPDELAYIHPGINTPFTVHTGTDWVK